MYSYKFGYYSWEESQYIELQHEIKYSKEDFYSICRGCITIAMDKLMDKHEKNKNIDIPLGHNGFQLSHIMNEVLNELYSRGFSKMNYEAFYSIDGWESICDYNDPSYGDSEELAKLRKEIPSRLRKNVMETAKKEYDEQMEPYIKKAKDESIKE